MEGKQRKALIARYREARDAVLDVVRSLEAPLLDVAPDSGWTPRMVVHHLADTEAFRTTRLRRLLTHDEPLILAFNEALWHYERPIEASLAFFNAAVDANLELLALMSEEDWQRCGRHSETGLFTMDEWLERAAGHLTEHLVQIREAVAASGSEGAAR